MMMSKKSIHYLLVIFLLIATLTGCSGIGKGSQAPDFSLVDLKGNTIDFADFRGKNVYLNFWASWCDPCKEEMPDMEKISSQYPEEDFAILTVNTGEDEVTVQSFIQNNGYTFPVLLDTTLDVAKLYQTNDIPVSFFINKEGIISSKKVGLMTEEEMKQAIDQLYQ